jgi:V8-like Glu-specific endopeptidase
MSVVLNKSVVRSLVKTCTLGLIGGLSIIVPSLVQSAQATVLGADDRVTLPYDWLVQSKRQPVGQLEIQKADGYFYTCTFTVIGENLGLTNAHCVLDEQGRKPIQAKGYSLRYNDRRFTAASVTKVWAGIDYEPETIGDIPRDWAIVKFNKKIARKTGTFGNEAWSMDVNQAGQSVVGKTVNLIGYSGDWPTAKAIKPGEERGRIPGAHLGCKITGVEMGVVVHTCDTNPGASGTGIHDDAGRLHGLHSASIVGKKGERVNVAVPLERFMPAIEALRKKNTGRRIRVPRV